MNTTIDACARCKKCEKVCPTLTLDIDRHTTGEFCIECHQCLAICNKRNENTNTEILGPSFNTAVQPYDFELLLQQRRSVRHFKNQDVPDDIIEEFITRMRFSPTASNTQDLSFTVIKHPDTLKQINDMTIRSLSNAFKRGVNNYTKWLITLFFGKNTYQRMKVSKDKFLRKSTLDPNMICYNAPALILIHAHPSPTSMPENNANIWLGMAMLYAQTLDLATCVNGYVINAANRSKPLRNLMQIPDKHIVYGALLLGYPKNKYFNRVDRKIPEVNFI